MRCVGLFVCLCVVAPSAGTRVNYCGAKMCGNTDLHTFCMYKPKPGDDCSGYIEAPLSKVEKSLILSRFNRRRNEAAIGMLRGMPSAGDMLKMRWIEELAKEAQLWANQCRPPSSAEERDQCRDLFSMSVGQCVASVVGEAPGLRAESMVDMWYMQRMLYKGNVTTYVPPVSGKQFYADFGQMMWSRSFMVGCGRSRFMVPYQGRLRSVERLVCNLSPAGPAPYRALWSPAAPASACPARSLPDDVYPGLCSYHSDIKATEVLNNTMTIEEHVILNTVFETEKNESNELNDIGSLDELYLTNLAIVTMEDVQNSTLASISIQKRDIPESKAENIYLNETMYSTTPKKKVSLIGRPKTYNLAELNEIDDDQNMYDNNEIHEEVPKNFNVDYGDYNIISTQENETNFTKVPSKQSLLKTSTEFAFVNNTNTSNNNEETADEIEDIITEATDIKLTESVLSITTAYINETTNEKSVEDYLNDPETVRQLQQAIDRAEHKMQDKKINKVRRELREMPMYQDVSSEGSLSTLDDSLQDNKTNEGPLLKMMVKYIPSFKHYGEGILGGSSSASSSGSTVLVILCLCSVALFDCLSFVSLVLY